MDTILILLMGIIIGLCISKIIQNLTTEVGTIDVDHVTNLCKLNVTSDQINKLSTKRVVFTVNHNAEISREEQGL